MDCREKTKAEEEARDQNWHSPAAPPEEGEGAVGEEGGGCADWQNSNSNRWGEEGGTEGEERPEVGKNKSRRRDGSGKQREKSHWLLRHVASPSKRKDLFFMMKVLQGSPGSGWELL